MICINSINYSFGRKRDFIAKDNGAQKPAPRVHIISQRISSADVQGLREKYGSNELTKRKTRSFVSHFISNFSDPIIKILLGALLLNIIFSFRHANWPETIGVAAAILIATMVSTVSEYSSCKAAERLSAEDGGRYVLRRDEVLTEVEISDIVVGDTVLLNPGMKIPADGVMTSGEVSCNQSALTGEGKEVKKYPSANLEDALRFLDSSRKMDTSHKNYVFRGSTVVSGFGEFTVLRTGDRTVYGDVAAGLVEESPESPLKKKLSVLAGEISIIGYIAAALVAISYLFNVFVIDSGMDLALALARMRDIPYLIRELINALTLAVSILVVAVPEGLPMMITVVLSSNMKKMLRHGVLVKRMVGIETAGSMSILFTDKTGTLTEGKMSLKNIITVDDIYTSPSMLKKNPTLYESLYNAAFCLPVEGSHNSADDAISEYFGIKTHSKSVSERIPFTSDKRYAAAVLTVANKQVTYFRGAPEIILRHTRYYVSKNGELMPFSDAESDIINKKWTEYAAKGSRIIASAFIQGNRIKEISDGEFPDMVLCGLVCLEDRLRLDAAKSVEEARSAGIKVIMMTGDNVSTAIAIARECGILKNDERAITGVELGELTDEELIAALPKISVIARALPSDKLRVVKAAREAGYISGMTGDGINDAPALKAADVGFSMGNGTDVTKEAGDIVITNNSFSSIIRAVLYGRTIFRSIRKFIMFQLTMNLCATAVSFVGPFIGIESPVTVIQMLWVNIIMDTLGALAFAGEMPRKEYMNNPPFPSTVKILTKEMIAGILLNGAFMVFMSVFFLISDMCQNLFGTNGTTYFLTAFFAFFIFLGIAVSFNSRTPELFFLSKIQKNKPFIVIMLLVAVIQLMLVYFGGEVFRCTPLTGEDILKCALLALSVIPFGALVKLPMNNIKNDL